MRCPSDSLRALRVVAASLAVGCTGGGSPEAPPATALPSVVTLSHPADWLVRRLAPASAIDRRLLLDPGADPATWQPSGAEIAGLATVDLIVANGAGFEAWTTAASLPASRLLSSADGLALVTLHHAPHAHGDGPRHAHAGPDPHTWLDPQRFSDQAGAVHDRLARLLPEHRAALDVNLATLRAELGALDADLQAAAPALRERGLAANHPSFTYLADRLDLSISAFDLDPDAAPPPQAAAAVAAWSATATRPVLLWEAEPSDAAIDALPGLTHATLDPLEQPQVGTYDYLHQAGANLHRLTDLGLPDEPPRPE